MSLVSDGDSKTMSLLQQGKLYRGIPQLPSYCAGHVQKRMGTALRNLKLQHRGQKISEYGDEIRRNKGDLDAMMKAVQASLLHSNSTDDNPRHHLCPEGEKTWCKWQTKF